MGTVPPREIVRIDRVRGQCGTTRSVRILPLTALVALCLLAFLCIILTVSIDSSAVHTPHEPILIDGDAGFTAANGVVSGNGGIANPFIIEGYDITGVTGFGIRVLDTRKTFIIRDVHVEGVNWTSSIGIHIENATDGTIENVTVSKVDCAIVLSQTFQVDVDNATLAWGGTGILAMQTDTTMLKEVEASGFTCGIELKNSMNSQAFRCRAWDNSRYGFWLVGDAVDLSSVSQLLSCNASSNGQGIHLERTRLCEIVRCVSQNNSNVDLYADDAEGMILDNTTLGRGGMYVEVDFVTLDIRDSNTVDGLPLRYLKRKSDLTIDSSTGQIFLVGCYNVTVANLTFVGIYQPITVYDSSSCRILDDTVEGAFCGISILKGGPIDLIGVRVRDGDVPFGNMYGISIYRAKVNITASNVSLGDIAGIELMGDALVRIDNTTIMNPAPGCCIETEITSDEQGQFIWGDISVVDCTIIARGNTGIFLVTWNTTLKDSFFYAYEDCHHGIFLASARLVVNGCILNSKTSGLGSLLTVEGASESIITSNSMHGPAYAGILIYYHNLFSGDCSGKVEDNDIEGCTNGIILRTDIDVEYVGWRVQDYRLINNHIHGLGPISDSGILFSKTRQCTITGCEVRDCRVGIGLEESTGILVDQCGVVNCSMGLDIESSVLNKSVDISGCDIVNCTTGISINGQSESHVVRCRLADCSLGLVVDSCVNLTINECTVESCDGYGISVHNGTGCVLHHNNLLRNNINTTTGSYRGPQSIDDSDDTLWDNGTEGNYWSDFTQRYPDAKPRGRVWDTPYDIDGPSGMRDRYPLTLVVDLSPPLAEAGDDVTVGEGTNVTLNGTRSSDDWGIVEFTWSFIYGDRTVTLNGLVTNFTFGQLGVYEVTLTVRDAWGNSGTDTMRVHVVDMVPPVAVAGDDITVNVGERFMLDGGRSHDDHGVTSYNWTVDPGGLNLTFTTVWMTLSIGTVGDYIAVLNVSDAYGNWATDSLVVHVRDLSSPIAEAGPDIFVDQGESVAFDGSGSRDNVGVTGWNWTFDYNGGPVSLDGVSPSFTFGLAGDCHVDLMVQDAAGHTARDSLIVHVRDTEPPLAEAGPDIMVGQGERFTLDGRASHDNVGVVWYLWKLDAAGLARTVEGGAIALSLPDAGTYVASLNVSDAAGNWAIDSVTITVLDTTPPHAIAGPDLITGQNVTVTFDGSRSSDNVGIIRYTWTFLDGIQWVTLTGPRPSHIFDTPGSYSVTLNVSDAAGNWATSRMVVHVLDTEPPVAIAGGNRTMIEGDRLMLDASSSHDNVGIVAYIWLVVSDEGNTTCGGPSALIVPDHPGTLKVTLRVEDAEGNSATNEIDILVLSRALSWRLGPFIDEEGRPIDGVHVDIVLNGTTYSGYTTSDGWLEVTVQRQDLVSPAHVTATKAGFERLRFTTRLDDDGDPLDPVPPMVRPPRAPLEMEWMLLILVIVGVTVGVALRILSRRKGKDQGG